MYRAGSLIGLTLLFVPATRGENPYDLGAPVGEMADGRIIVPTNQVLAPHGRQVGFSGRPNDLALSPDRRWLAVLNRNDVFLIDPDTGTIGATAKNQPASYKGIVFAPDGTRLYTSTLPKKGGGGKGLVTVFAVKPTGELEPAEPIELPAAGVPVGPDVPQVPEGDVSAADIPSGLAVTPDGKRLYVALNLANAVGEVDLATGKLVRKIAVGSAPYDVALVGETLYVSNWGGRRPVTGDVTGPAGRGTPVRVDTKRFIADDGSVSVIDLGSGKVTKEIPVGLHASALAVSPDRRNVCVANANSDSVSVIEVATNEVRETISTRLPDGQLLGASPNALAFYPAKGAEPPRLYVSNGTSNAVAVVSFNPGESKVLGFIPTGWYPAGIAVDPERELVAVVNIKGIGSRDVGWRGKREIEGKPVQGYNAHDYRGTVSLFPPPSHAALAALTETTLTNNRMTESVSALAPPRPDQPPRPIPQRHGEPSRFRHIVYIIKENRTYDQVFGDMKNGKGAPSLCIFGETITPNHHKLAREFVLLDNFYCCGSLSATGHQWSTEAYATDYLEKAFGGFPRSYPYDGGDALAYSPSGFLWDHALANGKSIRIYGEFVSAKVAWKDPSRPGRPGFLDCYRDFTNQENAIDIVASANIASLEPHICRSSIGFPVIVPDVYRAGEFIKELRQFEKEGGFPNLSILLLPNDHTAGTKPDMPTPRAAVADNDLALGRIVEAISHGRFWKETCIFVVEDDPQAGFDHVDGHRTVALAISPYTRRGATDSTNYTQLSMLRTIELALGLAPMNQLDASANAMHGAFTDMLDETPYVAVPANVPLDEINPKLADITDPRQRHWAQESIEEPFDEVDEADEDTLNRILWHAMRGRDDTYPAWAALAGGGEGGEADDDDD